MSTMASSNSQHTLLLLIISIVILAAENKVSGDHVVGLNPLSPKASLVRYWNLKLPDSPKPSFLFEKASPLDALSSSLLRRYADSGELSSRLRSFCDSARLFCFPEPSVSLLKHTTDSNFDTYSNRNFTNYRSGSVGGSDSFSRYDEDQNVVTGSFTRYGHDSVRHSESFKNYSDNSNVGGESFSSYASGGTGGTGTFTTYADQINVPELSFSNYDSGSAGRHREFTSYANNGNAGDHGFTSYGKQGTGTQSEFTSYGTNSNNIGNTFGNYGDSGTGETHTFKNYRDKANVGFDAFTNYGQSANKPESNFVNYGKSFNIGKDTFKRYGLGANGAQTGFKIYGLNYSFTDYADKKKVSFASYTSPTTTTTTTTTTSASSVLTNNKWAVEPGKFFHESMLQKGSVMPMPDIRDKMPRRSFLPRTLANRLPFASSKLEQLKHVFHAADNSSMEKLMKSTLEECERAPAAKETKRCITSVEDMVDFAVSVLGKNTVVRSTESTEGSGTNVELGEVRGLDGGKVTRSVSCHQSLFPYLVYYCHSVPVVRLYEADILDVKSKKKINHGVAICHLDTSAWGASHGAFLALQSRPGKTEVCHWIFENDMIWVHS